MAKKKHNTKSARDVMAIARRVAFLLVALVVLVSAMMAYHGVGRFLIDDPRFAIPAPEVSGEPSPAIVVKGVVNASRDRVLSVFAEDVGRSLALLPARERRLQLLAVDWVRDASVTRIWPNTVRVQILERQPVAYVQLSAVGGSLVSEMALIDADGVLLGQVGKPYQLPVLRGISKRQSEPERAMRVRRGLNMLAAVGTLGTGYRKSTCRIRETSECWKVWKARPSHFIWGVRTSGAACSISTATSRRFTAATRTRRHLTCA